MIFILKKFKIGYPTHPRKPILPEIEWIGKNGFDFVDLFLEEDEGTPEKINIKEVKKLLEKYKLDAVGHTAWYLPIGSPVKRLRKAAIEELREYFKVFNKLEVNLVTVHANWPSGIFTQEEGIKFQVETLKKVIEIAKNYEITIIYEPTPMYHDSIENTEKILSLVPELYLHFDIGHANLWGRKPDKFFKKFYRKIKHIHLHDNDGMRDLHLPMGCGVIEWRVLLPLIKRHYSGTITLEIFVEDKDFVLLVKEKLTKFLFA